MARISSFKAAELEVGPAKAEDGTDSKGLGAGEFKAVVSVFGNTDSYGDVVMPGAFTKSLSDWETSGRPVPSIWSHDWADPFAHVGYAKSLTETDRGLEIVGVIPEEDRANNPKAAQVYNLMKSGRVSQFSFAYNVVEGGEAERDGSPVYELKELELIEFGPCLVGVNPATELTEIKTATLEGELLRRTRGFRGAQKDSGGASDSKAAGARGGTLDPVLAMLEIEAEEMKGE